MTALLRPVTKMKCSIPAALASSTTCWMSGRSTTGSISLGMALVAGRNLVPSPATGKTAFRMACIYPLESGGHGKHPPAKYRTGFASTRILAGTVNQPHLQLDIFVAILRGWRAAGLLGSSRQSLSICGTNGIAAHILRIHQRL